MAVQSGKADPLRDEAVQIWPRYIHCGAVALPAAFIYVLHMRGISCIHESLSRHCVKLGTYLISSFMSARVVVSIVSIVLRVVLVLTTLAR